MKNAKCRMQNVEGLLSRESLLHFTLIILLFTFKKELGID